MVGYKKDDSLTSSQKLFAGCFSGFLTRFITQPMDVIKVRTQLLKQKIIEKGSKKKWFPITRRILKKEGVSAFWQGHNIGQVHSVLAVSSQFYVYELTTKYLSTFQLSQEFRPVALFFCGVAAGTCSTTLVIPLEVIRVRQMLAKEQYRGLLNGAKMVYSSGGILAFYEGLPASLMQMGPAVGISFTTFQLVQHYILKHLHKCNDDCKNAKGNTHKPEHLLLASTIAGSCAGFISKTLTYPFDLSKKRMQIASHKEDNRFQAGAASKHLIRCRKLSECLIETLKKEGFLGLFRGWKVTIYKAQLSSVVAFTTYELTCYAVREFGGLK